MNYLMSINNQIKIINKNELINELIKINNFF